MQGLFRFELDDFVVLEDQPIGWDSAKIKLSRNEDFGGLFIAYLTELEFWGDGYAYVAQQIEAIGYCLSIKIRITYQCNTTSPFEDVFIGYINIPNAEIDNEKCTVKANIELDNIYSTFLNGATNSIPLSTASVKLPSGEDLTPAFDLITYHSVSDGSYTSMPSSSNFSISISILNLFDYLTKYLTGGALPVVSEFFGTKEDKINLWDISISGATLKTGDTLSITFKNVVGKTITVTQGFITDETTTLNQLGLKLINVLPFSDLYTRDAPLYFDNTKFSYYTPITRGLRLESWIQINVLSFTVTGTGTTGTGVFSEFQSYENGGKNLYITPQYYETEQSFIWEYVQSPISKLSFKKLFDEVDKIFCLGIQLEGIAGSYVLRIEPLEYFFKNDIIYRVENPINVKTSFQKEYNFNNIALGSPVQSGLFDIIPTDSLIIGTAGNTLVTLTASSNFESGDYIYILPTSEIVRVSSIVGGALTLNKPLLFNAVSASAYRVVYKQVKQVPSILNGPQQAVTGVCIGDTLDLENDFCIDLVSHGDQTKALYSANTLEFSAGNDIDLFSLMQCKDGQISKPYPFLINVNGVFMDKFCFNGNLTNHHKILNNFIRIKQDVYSSGIVNTEFEGEQFYYQNNARVKPKRIHEFEDYMSFTDMLSLIRNSQQQIDVNIDRNGAYRKTWIYEIVMDVNTKKTDFKLYEN